MESAPVTTEARAPLLARWAFRTALGTVVAFLLLGVFYEFSAATLRKAALFAAVLSAVTHGEDEIRRRRSR